MHYLVYKITNTKNQKIYIGYHKTKNANDGYMGSGTLIRRAILKYGPESFVKEILGDFATSEEAEAYEAELVNSEFVQESTNYNLALGGNVRTMPGKSNPFYGKTHTPEARQKIRDALTGKPAKHGIKASVNGVIYSNWEAIGAALNITHNIRQNVMLAAAEREDVFFVDPLRQEAAEKFALRRLTTVPRKPHKNRGVELTEEHRLRISASLKGRKMSPEHVDKVNRNPDKIAKTAAAHRGMKRSDEAKSKMSAAKLGRPPLNKGKKYYRNPENPGEKGYFVPGTQPITWINRVKT